MSKPKFNFGTFIGRLKQKASGLFSKKNSTSKLEEEWGDDSEERDEDEFSEETDPSFQPLNVSDIKKNQVNNGEVPPDLPEFDLDDEDDYSVDGNGEDFDTTGPSIQEFDLKKNPTQLKDKFGALSRQFKDTLHKVTHRDSATSTHTSGSSFNLQKIREKFQRINFDEIFDKVFSPQNRPKVHRYFLAALFISTAYVGGRSLSTFLTPLPKSKTFKTGTSLKLRTKDVVRSKLAKMRNNDLFQAPEESNEPIKREQKPTFKEKSICNTADKRSSLGLKLMNTVILQDSVKSLASVQVRGKEKFLRVGDQIPNMVEIGKIGPRKLIFKNLKNRQCEYIENERRDQGPKKTLNIVKEPKEAKKIMDDTKETGITNVGNTFKIKKEVRARMLENISEVLTQARAIQIKNPDGSLAFRMQEIVPGSIYSQLNIQEGDLITGINGKKITNMAELMNLFGQIDQIDHFDLTLKREGMEKNLEYDFE